MKLLGLILAVLLMTRPAQAQQAIVEQVKTQLVAQGVNVTGACGAFRITNEVAKIAGVKLLHKAGGYRAVPQADGTCLDGDHSALADGYATDYVIDLRQGGVGFDILGDGGGANVPQWSGPETDPGLVARNLQNWRDPIATPALGPSVPIPSTNVPIVGTPPALDLSEVVYKLRTLEAELTAHEAAQAAEREKAEAFRQSVSDKWKHFGIFVAKYGPVVLGALYAGRVTKKASAAGPN